LFKYFNQQQPSRGRIPRDTILQKSKSIPEKEFVKLPPQASGTKSLGRNIRIKRKELAQLLVDHLEELIFSCSKVKSDPSLFSEEMETTVLSPSLQEIRAELEKNQTKSFTCEEIEYLCFQLKDQVIFLSLLSFPLCLTLRRKSSIPTFSCCNPSSHPTLRPLLSSKSTFKVHFSMFFSDLSTLPLPLHRGVGFD
jgi:hypothetical protein